MIPIVAIVTLLGLGTCVVTTGLLQNKRIGEFTEESPISVTPGEPNPATAQKLETISSAAKANLSVSVALTVEDLNSLIATQPIMEPYRETTRVTAITERAIEVRTSQPMRKLGKGQRFLNGDFFFTVDRSGTNYWQLILVGINPTKGEIPDGFINMFRDLHMFRFGADNVELQEVLKQVESIRLTDGKVIIETANGELGPPA